MQPEFVFIGVKMAYNGRSCILLQPTRYRWRQRGNLLLDRVGQPAAEPLASKLKNRRAVPLDVRASALLPGRPPLVVVSRMIQEVSDFIGVTQAHVAAQHVA